MHCEKLCKCIQLKYQHCLKGIRYLFHIVRKPAKNTEEMMVMMMIITDNMMVVVEKNGINATDVL